MKRSVKYVILKWSTRDEKSMFIEILFFFFFFCEGFYQYLTVYFYTISTLLRTHTLLIDYGFQCKALNQGRLLLDLTYSQFSI